MLSQNKDADTGLFFFLDDDAFELLHHSCTVCDALVQRKKNLQAFAHVFKL